MLASSGPQVHHHHHHQHHHQQQQQAQTHSQAAAGQQQAVADQLAASRCVSAANQRTGADDSDKQQPPATNKQLLELIDTKFNQLAKKILDELRQGQQSRHFCQALDAALSEPTGSAQSLASSSATSGHFRPARQRPAASSAADQPRSLPVETRPVERDAARPTRPVSAAAAPGRLKRSSPEPGTRHAYALSKSATTGDAPLARGGRNLGPFAASITTHPLLAGAGPKRARRRPSQDEFAASDNDGEDEDDDEDDGDDDAQDDDHKRPNVDLQLADKRVELAPWREATLASGNQRKPVIARHKTATQKYTDVQDADDHDEDDEDEKQTVSESSNNGRPQTVQQMVEKHQQKLQPAQQARPRFNPIQRSNTVGAANRPAGFHPATGGVQHSVGRDQPEVRKRSLVQPLSKRDIGSLYKPHMNYSTSLLGNHRLSDDDEIIIIPTQSPSLISTSPDMRMDQLTPAATDSTANEEAGERFSISRTKSFWEKLSKTNHGRRSQFDPPDVNESVTSAVKQTTTTAATNQQYAQSDYKGALTTGAKLAGANSTNRVNSIHRMSSSRPNPNEKKHHQPQHHHLHHHHHHHHLQKLGSSAAGAQLATTTAARQTTNGPMSHNLDRMDSTGGSNSNYSCSSSGDENSGPHSQQHNPVIGQIQEMSRQNRLRQTR